MANPYVQYQRGHKEIDRTKTAMGKEASVGKTASAGKMLTNICTCLFKQKPQEEMLCLI